jgi:cell division protein FtsB
MVCLRLFLLLYSSVPILRWFPFASQRKEWPVNNQRTETKYSVILVVGLLVALFFLSGYLERTSELLAVQAQVAVFQRDIDSARQWNLQLKNDLAYYASDEYVAEIARSELGYVQPGDDVFVVLEKSPGSVGKAAPEQSEQATSPAAEASPLSPFELRWWYELFR